MEGASRRRLLMVAWRVVRLLLRLLPLMLLLLPLPMLPVLPVWLLPRTRLLCTRLGRTKKLGKGGTVKG